MSDVADFHPGLEDVLTHIAVRKGKVTNYPLNRDRIHCFM